MWRKPRSVVIRSEREARPVRVVGDGAVATQSTADGRLIPVLILDTNERPDIRELIRIHEHFAPGDMNFTWSLQLREKVLLAIEFVRPVELTAILEFDIAKQGILVEQILGSKGVYLQAGAEGDRVIHDVNAPKITMEVPEVGFRKHWDPIFRKHIVARMRKAGLSRHNAKVAAAEHLLELKKMGDFRMKVR